MVFNGAFKMLSRYRVGHRHVAGGRTAALTVPKVQYWGAVVQERGVTGAGSLCTFCRDTLPLVSLLVLFQVQSVDDLLASSSRLILIHIRPYYT